MKNDRGKLSILKRFLMIEYYGTIAKPLDLSEEIIKSNLLIELKSVKAKKISSDNGIVSFKGGPFRLVSNMNPLIFIGSGKVDILIDDMNILYLLSFRIGHVMSFLGAVAVFIFLTSSSTSTSQVSKVLLISMFTYLIIFWANVLISLSNFKLLLKRCLSVKSNNR